MRSFRLIFTQSRNYFTVPKTSIRRKTIWRFSDMSTFVAMAGTGLTLSLMLSNTLHCKEPKIKAKVEQTEEDKSTWDKKKDDITGHYEDRVRETSAPEKIFEYFSSVTKNGQSFMTFADFIQSVVPWQGDGESTHGRTSVARKLTISPALKQIVDPDGNGLISYEEYIFFTSLLSIPPKYFGIAFRMLDSNGNGRLDVKEFEALILLARSASKIASASTTPTNIDNTRILQYFFGKNLKGSIDIAQFTKIMNQFWSGFNRLQFDYLDIDGDGVLSAKEFATNLVSYGDRTHTKLYRERISQLKSDHQISFEEYQNFKKALEQLPEIEVALHFVQAAGELNRESLKLAARAVSRVDLSDQLIEIIFQVLDVNQDGVLDKSELLGTLRGMNTNGLNKPRDSGFVRFLSCCKDCFSGQIVDRSSYK